MHVRAQLPIDFTKLNNSFFKCSLFLGQGFCTGKFKGNWKNYFIFSVTVHYEQKAEADIVTKTSILEIKKIF